MNDSRDEQKLERELRDVHQRENMDALTVKVLVALNGGGAIALLTFSSEVMGNGALQDAAFTGILILVAGLLMAVLYNVFREKCSEAHAARERGEEACMRSCRTGDNCRVASLVLFVLGAASVPVVHLLSRISCSC